MTDEDIEKIIKRHMSLQMNLAGMRADFEETLRKPFVGLTDDEILEAAGIDGADTWLFKTAYAIEAKLRERNGGQA